MGYIQMEDIVLDCLEEVSSNEANDKLQILLFKKMYPEDAKSSKKQKYSMFFIKTCISLLCIRISIESNKELLMYY